MLPIQVEEHRLVRRRSVFALSPLAVPDQSKYDQTSGKLRRTASEQALKKKHKLYILTKKMKCSQIKRRSIGGLPERARLDGTGHGRCLVMKAGDSVI